MAFRIFRKTAKKPVEEKTYTSTVHFVNENIGAIKQFMSQIGEADIHKRLGNLATLSECSVLLLCSKHGADSFRVLETSDSRFNVVDTKFVWQHQQSAASSDAAAMLDTLPFPKLGATSFISVPIKDTNNHTIGILLGLSPNRIENIDDATRLLHMVAPLFKTELECETLRQNKQQDEQRIASLNQNIEAMSTDLKKERERSLENKGLKSIFLTNLSHEIRTPMNVVVGFVDLLDSAQTEAERKDFISIIKQNCQLLLKVIDNLIEISKLQSSYMFKPARPQQLNTLLLQLKNQYIDKMRQFDKNLTIKTSFDLETPNDTIWNSEEIIRKSLDQLLDNAFKFTNDGGTITFGYTMSQKEATFFVRDTGCGITPGTEETIFNMFGVSDDPAHNEFTGCGIGLSIARKYISLANGKIWVDTTYTGGAQLLFTIPVEKL